MYLLKELDRRNPTEIGQDLYRFAVDLYPICRSITGNGIRRTLTMIEDRIICLIIVLLPLWGCTSSSPASSAPLSPRRSSSSYPLRVSSNHRYLVDQNNVPVLLVGDSPHSMFVNLDSTELATYLANRQGHRFNILWVEALCSDYIPNCRNDLSTYDGIKPFTSGTDKSDYDISTTNPAFWSRVDSYVRTSADYGMTILFDVWETGALMPLARTSGNRKMYDFGAFLGNRYKDVPNIIWITGNDFQTWADNTDNMLMQNLMAGILSTDKNHLQTTELNRNVSGSLDDSLLVPYTTLAGAYDYYCAYGETLAQYNQASPVPVFFEEGYYEYNPRFFGNKITTLSLRTQEWWAALSGATAGQMYGNERVYPFSVAWQRYLDTVAVTELGYLTSLLESIRWYDLIPDQNHTVVTSGYGTRDPGQNPNCINTNNYVTTSYLADGTTSVSYTPTSANLTVDLSRISDLVTARWYDPTSGSYNTISGSPFSNSGTKSFSTPGNNSAGNSDWVLLLTASK